ncbi:MAG: hypothetical protein MZV63_45610 [Marinilabiliales bacterium]|nr:hypothetical protein [Marinilabiliales bacterium]
MAWAKIDPYDKIDLDVNRINNSCRQRPEVHGFTPYDEQVCLSYADDDLTIYNLISRKWIFSEYLKREPSAAASSYKLILTDVDHYSGNDPVSLLFR